jgi:hypothetical protein
MIVSLEKPVAPGPANSPSSTSPPTFSASQAASAFLDCSTSRWAGIGTVDSFVGVGGT